ncbi:hypothetical protein [Anaeromyxobacter soli]|uniref:hypothetical protein n=1 Tax=Anaeromyxobacter soli TaxID=2922725 RepID=UPI001FAEA98E|nr:hypothetical protein [Anaeromyxobacter sp. SG29]
MFILTAIAHRGQGDATDIAVHAARAAMAQPGLTITLPRLRGLDEREGAPSVEACPSAVVEFEFTRAGIAGQSRAQQHLDKLPRKAWISLTVWKRALETMLYSYTALAGDTTSMVD